MNILVIGAEERYEELRSKMKDLDQVKLYYSNGEDEDFASYDAIFDLNFDDDQGLMEVYGQLKNKLVFVSAVKMQVAEAAYLYGERVKCHLIGFNALPTFIDRSKWEISATRAHDMEQAKHFLQDLNIDFEVVEDRVGMVTPRIIFMIINEACYTLQEGTASIADIDLGMKLGTNYPMGPFEWADKIGVTDVFETLNALYEDTHDERYKICPLLKTQYLKNKAFIKVPA